MGKCAAKDNDLEDQNEPGADLEISGCTWTCMRPFIFLQAEGEKKAERKGGVDLQLFPEALHPHVLGEGGGQVQAR